jgi:hypothetical protein
MELTLYRGDKIDNQLTQPGIYRGNGLTTKAFYGGGDPAYIDKMGLLETIRIHINPKSPTDFLQYNKSGYLSFTTDVNRALFWASDKGNPIDKVTDDYTETRYIFKAVVPTSDMTLIADGIFEYKFSCNTNLKTANAPDPGFVTWSYRQNICHICRGQDKTHSLILIDTVTFLEKHKNMTTYDGAFRNASEDMEWLLLPNDPLGTHTSARIHRADFWKVHHLRLRSELPRDPFLFQELGQIIEP